MDRDDGLLRGSLRATSRLRQPANDTILGGHAASVLWSASESKLSHASLSGAPRSSAIGSADGQLRYPALDCASGHMKTGIRSPPRMLRCRPSGRGHPWTDWSWRLSSPLSLRRGARSHAVIAAGRRFRIVTRRRPRRRDRRARTPVPRDARTRPPRPAIATVASSGRRRPAARSCVTALVCPPAKGPALARGTSSTTYGR